jgi:hypothetical protein
MPPEQQSGHPARSHSTKPSVGWEEDATTNYVELHQHLEERLVQLGRELPGPMSGFARLHKKAVEDGALSGKAKELMAVAISTLCIAKHVLPIMSRPRRQLGRRALNCSRRSG